MKGKQKHEMRRKNCEKAGEKTMQVITPERFFFNISTTPFALNSFLELVEDKVYLVANSGLVPSNS